MGFFSFLDPIVKPITKVVKQALPVVATGGLSLVSSDVKRAVTKVTNPLAEFGTNPSTALSLLPQTRLATSLLPAMPRNSGGPMGLDVGGILRGVGGIFGGNQNPIFQGISEVSTLGADIFTGLAKRPTQMPPTVPMIKPAARGLVGRSFFNRFPNLGLAIQQLRDRGLRVKRSQLWSILKRFGPEVLITGGLLTAAAVNELMVAGPGHRRMNPANVKALRRSIRRLDSFHRLCVSADKLRRPRGKSCKSNRGSSQQFVRQG